MCNAWIRLHQIKSYRDKAIFKGIEGRNFEAKLRRVQAHLEKCAENAIQCHGDLWQPALDKVDSETCPTKFTHNNISGN
jgi:fructosamine-3-kinase